MVTGINEVPCGTGWTCVS